MYLRLKFFIYTSLKAVYSDLHYLSQCSIAKRHHEHRTSYKGEHLGLLTVSRSFVHFSLENRETAGRPDTGESRREFYI